MMTWLLGFIFFACERLIVVNSQVWPQGTYGLPKPVSGCPANWQDGWIKQDLENSNPRSEFSVDLNLHMEATLTGGDIRRSFCIKTSTDTTKSWPAGSYCIYKKNQCPSGMNSGSIKWDNEDDTKRNSKGGTLPDGTFGDDTIIEYCCQNQGLWSDSIELPLDKPFYLLPHNSQNCQRVKEAKSTLEYIIYDTENDNNYDDFIQSHVFTNKVKNLPKIYYCYYEGCQHKLQKESGAISTTHFPDYQYCSWSITVNQGSAVSLTLTLVNIPSCNTNYMNIYDGSDDTAPILMSLCGDNATSGIRLRSTGNNMFIMLRSGQNSLNGGNIQFQADFKTTAPFSGISWPSGTYGFPKTNTSCPDMWIPGWRKQIMEDDSGTGSTSLSTDLRMHMDVSLVDYALTRHFCTKTIDSGGTQKAWPAGMYCIYKKNQCPSGMKDGFIKWDDEDTPNKDGNDKHGILPDGEFGTTDGNDLDTKISYCCNDQGDWKQSIELPVNELFYLLPHQSKNCQRVKGALSTLEHITYDTEDSNNHDALQGSHAYKDDVNGLPTIYYCYYKGCQCKLETDSGSFGADNFPAYQYCSWSITVKHGLEVYLEFTTLNIPDCLGNQLEIYDGVDSTGSLLATYCAKNATSGNTLRSTGNNVYVMFRSGANNYGGSLQFQARYKAEDPITEPTWPSGTYGLPKTNDSCPPGWVQGSRKQDMERDGTFQSAFSSPFDMDAVLNQAGRYIKRKFCMKTFSNGKNKPWPVGTYCIYKRNTCPTGMAGGSIHWDDEDNVNSNQKEGILPDGTYDVDTEINYCCRNQGNWYDPIELPVSVPIFLLPYKSKNCQRVKWAISKLQFITYDTDNNQNRDSFQGSHVYAENKISNLPTVYYCYYEGCQYKINAESPSSISILTSPNKDFQNCSWLLSVKYGNISLTFNSMSVPYCSKGNFIEIYDGPSDQAPSIARYCGTTTVTGGSITSTGMHLFMLVKSGNNVQMGTTVGFYATFKNNQPGITVAPPTTDITPGKTTMKSSTTLVTTSPTMSSTTSPITSPTTSPPSPTMSPTTSPTTSPPPPTTTSSPMPPTPSTSPTTSPAPPPTSPSTMTSTPPETTQPTTQILTSKLPTSVRKTTTTGKLPTTSASSIETSLAATTKVSTQTDVTSPPDIGTLLPDVSSSDIPETTKPVMKITTSEDVQLTTTSGIKDEQDNSSGGNNPSTALAIVIPVCITFLVAVSIVMFFYRRRQSKDNSTQRSTNGGNQHSNPEYNASFQSPDKVRILPNGGKQVDISSGDKNNPLYESGECHTYCSIEDVQNQYKKEIGLRTKPSQSTLYETPVDPGASTSAFNPGHIKGNENINHYDVSSLTTSNPPNVPPKNSAYETPVYQGASTSSFNPLYTKGSENTNPYQVVDLESSNSPTMPPEQSGSDTPLSTALSTSYDTPQSHYKSPGNPYDTMIPKKDTNPAYDVSPMNTGNQPPRTSYQNVPNGNNNPHYQTPTTKPGTDVYEVMHGRNSLVDVADNTGMTQC